MNTPEDLLTRVASSTDIREACEEVEDWFSRHDLVDLTTCGPQCPAWRVMVGAPRCIATFRTLTVEEDPDYDARIDNAPIGQPCPVMAARRGTT